MLPQAASSSLCKKSFLRLLKCYDLVKKVSGAVPTTHTWSEFIQSSSVNWRNQKDAFLGVEVKKAAFVNAAVSFFKGDNCK